MKFEALALKDSVGSEIRTDVDSLLTPEVAGKIRQLLVERSGCTPSNSSPCPG